MKKRYFVSAILCGMIVLNIFYISARCAEKNNNEYTVGTTYYVGESEGYDDIEKMTEDNPHFGWELGDFWVSNYTQVIEKDGKLIFLKNVGDDIKVTFRLNTDIDCLNNDSKKSIASDKKGYDETFGIPKTDFGRGMLITRQKDYQGKLHDPVKYKDYLNGLQKDADTSIELKEEGDYEVALDYKIKVDKGWTGFIKQTEYDYVKKFSISIRNGNCMVYPFDVKTKSELNNTAFTEYGFYLDFAKSRYIDINVKKEILNEGANGLVEDVRFNRPASDGEEYTEEGIYTITASNKYTNQETQKVIYVGTNSILKAHVTTGKDIEDINNLIENGASIDESGNILTTANMEKNDNVSSTINDSTDQTNGLLVENVLAEYSAYVVVGVIGIVLVIVLLLIKKVCKRM